MPRRSVATLAAAAATAVVAAAAAGACSASGGAPISRVTYVVRVDSVSGNTAWPGALPLTQRLHGVLGPDGCSRLKNVAVTQSAHQVDVTVYAERTLGVGCTDILPLLDVELTIQPPALQPFRLVVHQPDGTLLERALYPE